MKIVHAVIRKLRPRARHPDGVRGLVSEWREKLSPPILAAHVPCPFRLALRGEGIFVPIAEHRIRKGNDDTPITFGWSYVHWRHFLAHVLLAGFPEISAEAISLSLRCRLLSQIGNRCFLRGRSRGQGFYRASLCTLSRTYRRLSVTGNNYGLQMLGVLLRISGIFRFRTSGSSPVGCGDSRLNESGCGCESVAAKGGAA